MAALIDRFMDDDEEAPKTESLEVDDLEASADEGENLGDGGTIN
jgi:hypothetical protein